MGLNKKGYKPEPEFEELMNKEVKDSNNISTPEITLKTPTITPDISKTIKSSIEDILKQNYTAINNRDFKEAYNLRSKSYKSKTSYEAYYDIWKTNITIRLLEAEILEQSDKRAKAKIKLYSEDNTLGSEQINKAIYNGIVYLINEDGNWKIGGVDINSSEKINRGE